MDVHETQKKTVYLSAFERLLSIEQDTLFAFIIFAALGFDNNCCSDDEAAMLVQSDRLFYEKNHILLAQLCSRAALLKQDFTVV